MLHNIGGILGFRFRGERTTGIPRGFQIALSEEPGAGFLERYFNKMMKKNQHNVEKRVFLWYSVIEVMAMSKMAYKREMDSRGYSIFFVSSRPRMKTAEVSFIKTILEPRCESLWVRKKRIFKLILN